MNRIEIEIDPLDFEWPYSAPLFESWCMRKLIKAGIPVKGFLVFGGVKFGTLIRCDDFKNYNMRFVWKDSPNNQLQPTVE